MPSYSDVQRAVRVEKSRIWFAWVCGGWVGLGVALATKDKSCPTSAHKAHDGEGEGEPPRYPASDLQAAVVVLSRRPDGTAT